jgi:ubiquinone/menaquinone biosynthesis C-methylase UbiE
VPGAESFRASAALAGRLGPASVGAADPSEPFVEACRARLPGVEVVVAAAEALPFADGSFDAALSQLVVNFMRDADAGVREMARDRRRLGVDDGPFELTARAWAVAGIVRR